MPPSTCPSPLSTNIGPGLVFGGKVRLSIKREPDEYLLIPRRWSSQSIKEFLGNGPLARTAGDVFAEVSGILDKYIEFANEGDKKVCALWTIGTYVFPMFQAYPYLYVGGWKGSGKTKLLTVISELAFNAVLSANVTPAALFRTVEAVRPSFLIDEAEGLAKRDQMQEIRQLLNSGYRAGGKVQRAEKSAWDGPYRPAEYGVYSPKIIAAIRRPEAVLVSRCISVTLLRTANPRLAGLAVGEETSDFQAIRDALYHYLMGQGVRDVRQARDEMPTLNLVGRERDLWEPLLTVAWAVSPDLFQEVLEMADQKGASAELETATDTPEGRLLIALAEGLTEPVWYSPSDIATEINGPVPDENSIPAWLVGRMLAGLSLKVRRVSRGKEYYLSPEIVEDLVRRYMGRTLEESQEEEEPVV